MAPTTHPYANAQGLPRAPLHPLTGGLTRVFSLGKSPAASDGYTLLNRALGAYLGLAIGDALGATVEFMTTMEIRGQYKVHKNLCGGGWLRLKPGQITDDTQMCLALGKALLAHEDWNLRAVAESYLAWMRSRPVDIGNTCRRGIQRFLIEGSLEAKPSNEDGGNGALMRNLPLVLATLSDDGAFTSRSLQQAHITHNHPLSDAAILAHGAMTRALLAGEDQACIRRIADALVAAHGCFSFDPYRGSASGYVVDTMQAVLDAFLTTQSFEDCLVKVVNRGGDADTTGALAGQLAGAYYGLHAIPVRWLRKLDPGIADQIRAQTAQLLQKSKKVSL